MSNLVQRLQDAIAAKYRRIVFIGDAIADRWIHGRVEECQDGCHKFIEGCAVETYGGAMNAWNCLLHWKLPPYHLLADRERWPVKTRFVVDGKIVYRWDRERELIMTESERRLVISRAMRLVDVEGAVLLSDYDKRFLFPDLIRAVVDRCTELGIPCVADCKREPKLYDGCILKCNEEYAKKYASELEQYDGYVIITRGSLPPIVRTERAKAD